MFVVSMMSLNASVYYGNDVASIEPNAMLLMDVTQDVIPVISVALQILQA